ncbi:MAG: KGG domain-containing protein [Mesorhizobium sp.]
MPNEQNSDRGFASMDENKQREIASKGGSNVPDEKRSFSKDPQLAAEAGREGGQQSSGQQDQTGRQDQNRGSQQQAEGGSERQQGGERGGSGNFANDPERAAEAGHKGGQR